MTPPLTKTSAGRQRALSMDAAQHLAVVGFAVLAITLWVAVWLAVSFGAGIQLAAVAMLVYGLGACLIWRGLKHHPFERFGAANRITLCRMASVSLLVALVTLVASTEVGMKSNEPPWFAWALVGVCGVTALLDAFDGALARRTGMSSDFGARFDMETDAAFILILCALVWQQGVTGPWILAAGGMRYAFVAASWLWPWLNGPLPPSRRRQTVCVVQVVFLVLALAPVIKPLWALALCACGLAALTISFVIDMRYLFLRRNCF